MRKTHRALVRPKGPRRRPAVGPLLSPHFVAARPSEEDDGAAVFEIHARLNAAEGEFAVAGRLEEDGGRADEVERVIVPDVTLDDPPVVGTLLTPEIGRDVAAAAPSPSSLPVPLCLNPPA